MKRLERCDLQSAHALGELLVRLLIIDVKRNYTRIQAALNRTAPAAEQRIAPRADTHIEAFVVVRDHRVDR